MDNKISLGEDLMREHGLMNRMILLYKESASCLGQNPDAKDVLQKTAKIMKEFIHDFHEENEEHDVYPLLTDNAKLRTLTETMEKQHEVGKQITEYIISATKAGDPDATALSAMTAAFERMYLPHASLEDTVLWPALQELKGDAFYMKLGADLEKKEEERFGEEYFEKLEAKIEKFEKKLGIGDLAKFTASVPDSAAAEEMA